MGFRPREESEFEEGESAGLRRAAADGLLGLYWMDSNNLPAETISAL